MICGLRLWWPHGPFVKGGPSRETQGPQKSENQENAGQKKNLDLVPNVFAISSTHVQNVQGNTGEPAVKTVSETYPKIMVHQMLPTPIRQNVLDQLLIGYDKSEIEYLNSGFKKGFSIEYVGDRVSRLSKNLISCFEKPEEVQKKLQKETALGRIAGPFLEPPFQADYIISPIGIVPKSETGQFRLIQHLSFPENNSVNDGIIDESKTVNYASIDDAIAKLKTNGNGALMSKSDIDSAFRLIPVIPDDYPLLGMKFNHRYYYDKCLPMGCSSSCHIFERFSTALEWIATHKFGIQSIIHYLDDFLIVGPANSDQCETDLNNFLSMCERIGVPIKSEKQYSPQLSSLSLALNWIQCQKWHVCPRSN